MSRAAVLSPLFVVCSLTGALLPASGQAPEIPVPPAVVNMPPPLVPAAGAPMAPVAPPLPGQLQAVPAAVPAAPIPLPPFPGGDALAPNVPLSKNKAVSSTSTSGQFIVHGEELTLRSALSSKCEDFATELRSLLHDKQPWVLPVVVLLSTGEKARKADKPVSTVISQLTHGGFHIQVNVNMRPDLRPADLRKEVIRALMAERILRDQKEIVTKRTLLLPDWLFLGIIEAVDYRQRARPSALFAAIFKSGKIFGIEEIIEASSTDIEDGLSKTIYQTSCCALVLALLDQPESGMRMSKFLDALASDPRSERELLNQWFPNFASTQASLNKWWALQLATLASPGMAEPLSPQDTIAALDEALTFHFEAKAAELPRTSRRVVATPKPKEPEMGRAPSVSHSSPKPEAKDSLPSIGEPTDGKEDTAKEKRGFMSRLNPFSRGKSSDDEIADAIEEAARAESQSLMPPAEEPVPGADVPPAVASQPVPPPAAGGSGRKPLFDRWFGEEAKESIAPPPPLEIAPPTPAKAKPASITSPDPLPEKPKPTPKVAAPKSQPPAPKAPAKETAKPEAPAPTAAADPSEPEKKPSRANPLNWFRGGKKEKSEEAQPEATEEPKEAPKDKKAFRTPAKDPFADMLARDQPIVAMVFQQVAAAATEDEPEPAKKGFLGGLFGKKKPESDAPEPEAPKKPEEKAKPAAQPAPKAKDQPTPPPQPPAPAVEEEFTDEKTKRQPRRLRLFGSDKKDSSPEEVEEKAKKEMPAEEATTPPVEPEQPPATEPEKRKRQPLRLNLFGNGNKDEPEETETAPMPPSDEASPPAATPPTSRPAPPTVSPRPRPQVAATADPASKDQKVKAALPIEDYAAVVKRKDLDQIIGRSANSLAVLQNRASVLFRPIIKDYVQALEDIHAGKTKGLDARLKALRTRTQEALAQSNAVRDQLDLHEANDSPAMSGIFDDYLKLPETIQKELPERNDPISKYLDALDKEFSKD